MITLVLLRHGQSIYNRSHEFTGWTDIDLTEQGVESARDAGKLLRAHGFIFDIAYTSLLRRAIKTLWFVLDEMDLEWLPVENTWTLNERHYGALQEMNKEEMAAQLGEEQIQIWRRSFDVAPPALQEDDERHPKHDPRYEGCNCLPSTESLKECIERTMPFWQEKIEPKLREHKRVLVAAHHNSLRGIVKYLDNVSDEDIVNLNIPTGVPLIYELDDDLKPIKHYYLGNQDEIDKAIEDAKNQGKSQ